MGPGSRRARVQGQAEIGLLAADELDIDFGQDFSVEERPVTGAAGIVDPIARAERIEAVRRAG